MNETAPNVDMLLAQRQRRLNELVARAEDLVREADSLRQEDTYIASEFKSGVFTPWRDAIMGTFDELRVAILSHLPEIRAGRELTAQGEAALCVSQHGEVLRNIRRLTAKLTELRRGRPTGPPRLAQSQTIQLTRSGPLGPSNVASEILALVLPPTGTEIAGESISDILSRLRLGDAGVPDDILHGEQGSQPPLWDHPAIVRLLALEPAEVSA